MKKDDLQVDMKRELFKQLFDCVSAAILLSVCVALTVMFFTAFLNDNQCMVYVNAYGEGWGEAIVLLLCIVMGAISFIRILTRKTDGR